MTDTAISTMGVAPTSEYPVELTTVILELSGWTKISFADVLGATYVIFSK